MDAKDVRKLLLKKWGVRIEPEMSNYLISQLAQSDQSVQVMAQDARTGAPLYQQISTPPINEGLT